MIGHSLDDDVLVAERAADVPVGVGVVDNLVAELVYYFARLAFVKADVSLVEDELGAAVRTCALVRVPALLQNLHCCLLCLACCLLALFEDVLRPSVDGPVGVDPWLQQLAAAVALSLPALQKQDGAFEWACVWAVAVPACPAGDVDRPEVVHGACPFKVLPSAGCVRLLNKILYKTIYE